VNGAGAFLAAMASKRDRDPGFGSSLCSRWFWSIQALAAVTDFGLSDPTVGSTIQDSDEYYFDLYTGYSSDLNIALMQIGLLAHRRNLIQGDGKDTNQHPDEVKKLENAIRNMISRDRESGLKFPSRASLDADTIGQFRACNTAYQHACFTYILH
jgi:hypothetical protein